MEGDWRGRHGGGLDAALLGGLALVGLAGHVAVSAGAPIEAAPLSPASAVGAVSLPALLWFRRRAPLRVTLALLAGVVVVASAAAPGLYAVQLIALVLVALFSVGAWSEHTVRTVLLGAVLFALVAAGSVSDGQPVPAALVFGLALAVLPIVAGYATRTRRRYVEEVERRLAAAERERDERARRAVDAERARLARELHDVVAHHVSLIGVQAGAARYALDPDAVQARAALGAIEASSRQAVSELRQLLAVLRPLEHHGVAPSTGEGPPEPPQPGLTRLPSLVAQWRSAGMTIDWAGEGTAATTLAPIAEAHPGWSSACYRIVEEALTNVARHAATAMVTLELGWQAGSLRIAVADRGPARPPAAGGAGGGRGLRGMRERTALYGGSLAAGPTRDGGFLVVALVPLPSPPSGDPAPGDDTTAPGRGVAQPVVTGSEVGGAGVGGSGFGGCATTALAGSAGADA